MDSSTKSRKTASTSSSTSSTKGVQKFYTKIRHKIEDIPPKITAKLNKNNTTQNKLSLEHQRPTAPPRAAKRNRNQFGKRVVNEIDKQLVNYSSSTMNSVPSHYENVMISSNPNGLHDSDEECRMSLNDSTLSLEDEIFEELEKVAHDEAKLKAVLKNFDKILTEFNERNIMINSSPALKLCNSSISSSSNKILMKNKIHKEKSSPPDFDKQPSENYINGGHKTLQKSKTCSIIESRCILKKSISDRPELKSGHLSLSDDFPHFKAFQVTKSLWNLKDFEEFSKTGQKMEKFECKLPILKIVGKNCTNSSELKCSPKPEIRSKESLENIKQKLNNGKILSQKVCLSKSKSVWELSPGQNCINQHNTCTRTHSSGSKIPIMKTFPQKFTNIGRSNSFCDRISSIKQDSGKSSSALSPPSSSSTLSSSSSSSKLIQVGKVLPIPKRNSSGKNTTVNKIVRNLNEMNSTVSLKTSSQIKQPLIRTTSSLSVSSHITKCSLTNTSLSKKRSVMSSASSTPHSLHKIGISTKVSSTMNTSYSSSSIITPSSSSLGGNKLKSANSELSLNILKQPPSQSSRTAAVTKIICNNKNKKHQSDIILNKCLQKGHELLRKVEAFGSVTKLPTQTLFPSECPDRGNSFVSKNSQKRDIITSFQIKQATPKDAVSINNSPADKISTSSLEIGSQDSHPTKAYTLVVVNRNKNNNNNDREEEEEKEKPDDNRIGTFKTTSTSEDTCDGLFRITTPKIFYATESTVQFPQLESCKIIPPILGHPSQKTAELLVNIKTMQHPLRIHQDSMLCINSDVLRSEKEYQSDCSEDSGHISNENDDIVLSSAVNYGLDGSNATAAAAVAASGNNSCTRNQKGTKISELLEKFEPVAKEGSFNCTSITTSTSSKANIVSEECSIEESNLKRLCTSIKVAEVRPINCMTSSMEICPMYSSEVLFRSGVLGQLEAKRDELLSGRIVQLQAYCRGYLARRRVAQRRVQELAVRCIQRNVKAFLTVRDWPWWRLLVRVTPLLNVHRTEEQLKIANDELQSLKVKLEKIENDRNVLKTENDKLETKLSEMTVDLAEERSASNIASERLEAETAERLKLERELQEQQHKVKNLQETSEKLEMELICAKSDLNGISEDEDADNEDSGGVYKLKYERVARELEFTKRRLQSQHEHDLEQLVGLKKQLEKKLADAYEEVEEQRQVVGQWKRKAQKMTNEMNDLRMLLEEQNGRNNLLEKKQRKFDSECQALQDAARQERQAKERLSREKDVLIAEKFTLEQNLADTRLELDLKEEKLAALQRELTEMTFGGGTEEEVAQLRRSKMDLDRRLKEQEEELDEMAGQVQLLEQAKLRLEMTLETMRKDARKEAQQRDDELEEARGSAFKKIKALECQLETEHEERTLLLREKHELERRLQAMEEQDRADRTAEEAINQKLRKDLRKYKALLKDAHAQLERLKADSPGKAIIRQLRNQLEDAEAGRSMAIKARHSAEAELSEVQSLLDEAQRARSDAEDKATAAHRDRTELQAQIEENEEEMSELMKKFSQTVKQLNNEQTAISEAEIRISELEAERNSLKEQVAELQTRLENIENMSDPSVAVQSKRLELRAKELESRLELEQATRARLEVQASRHKDALEKVQNEVTQSKMREIQVQETLKKAQKNLRELREEFHTVSNREQESIARRKDLEKKLETTESEVGSLRNDLRLALQRIADLQQAMEEGDDDVTESDESDSTDASLSDLEQRLRPIQIKRSSVTATKDRNGLDDATAIVLKDRKSDNSPRITVTSPSTTSIRDDALKNGDTSFA